MHKNVQEEEFIISVLMLNVFEVLVSSKIITFAAPASAKDRDKLLPMAPAPPVTKIRVSCNFDKLLHLMKPDYSHIYGLLRNYY